MASDYFKLQVKQAAAWGIGLLPDPLKNGLLCALLEHFYSSRREGIRHILSTEAVLKNLKENGFNPARIIDCGAYVGDWTRMIRRMFPHAKVLMIEANKEKEPALKEVRNECPEKVDYAIALLGAGVRESVAFYKMETGSSVFAEQSNVPRDVLHLPMRALWDVAREKGMEDAAFIKIDVQGNELEILKGGLKILEKADCVLLEVSFLQYNEAAPLIGDVVRFMEAQGFVIYDIGTLVRWGADNSLLQGDFVFIRKNSPMRLNFFRFAFTDPDKNTDSK